MSERIDPVRLTAELVRCESVTPAGPQTFDVLEGALRAQGFACTRLRFDGDDSEPVLNLFATCGEGAPHIAFNGHLDTVPAGPRERWSHDPFGAEIADGALWGRGAADMKSAVAAFAAAAAAFLHERPRAGSGTVSLLVTGDEEGVALNGTRKLLAWAHERGERFDGFLVGEPTSRERLGDMAKIGRRGSLTGRLTVRGIEGHTAYPHRADNAAHKIVRVLESWLGEPIDAGNDWFQPSDLQITRLMIDNEATNVIPGEARAHFNIRYNDRQSEASLREWLFERARRVTPDVDLVTRSSGDAFLTEPGALSACLVAAVREVTGIEPELSTSGGTSDARFVTRYAPVVEFGLVGATIHQSDEHARVEDIEGLARIYGAFLERAMAAFPR